MVCIVVVDLFDTTFCLELVFWVFYDCLENRAHSLACAMHFGVCTSIGGHDEFSLGPTVS